MLRRKDMLKMLGMGGLCLFLLGCSEESFLLQKEEASTVILEEEAALSQDLLSGKESEQAESVLPISNSQEEQKIESEIAVHICGAVKQPGVYYFKEKQRLHEGIQKAGGFLEEADQDYLNQAMMLEDGMKIIVPTREETSEAANGTDFVQTEGDSEAFEKGLIEKKDLSGVNTSESTGGKVDLNTADEALLCTLPGIGESRARSIIAYREEHGPFQKPEDIMKISGIKEAAYEKLKDYVTVSK